MVCRKIARFEKIAHGWERRIERSRTFLPKKEERRKSGRKHRWKILRAVQIFVGAEKQSGIRSARYGTATRSEDARDEAPGYRNRKRVKKGATESVV